MCLASTDLLDRDGASATAFTGIGEMLYKFPDQLIELVGIYPAQLGDFYWQDIPKVIKQRCEMRFHSSAIDDVYQIYGVSAEKGAIAVIRPDGYVGMVAPLSGLQRVDDYLSRAIRRH